MSDPPRRRLPRWVSTLVVVLLAAVFLTRHEEPIGRRLVLAGLLIVAGGALIGVGR